MGAVVVALAAVAVVLGLAALLRGGRTLEALAALAAIGTAANFPVHTGEVGLELAGPVVAVLAAFALVTGAVAVLSPEDAPPRRTAALAVACGLLFALGLTLLVDAVVHTEIQVIR